MQRFRVEFDASWSPEKCRMVSVRIRQDLAMYGGVANVSAVQPLSVEEQPPALPPKLKFYCNANPGGHGRCTATWESETFSECPVGHGRKWVHKGVRTDEVASA